MQRTNTPRVMICVPARNERERLPALLSALAVQGYPVESYGLCVVFDGCDDGGLEYVQNLSSLFPFGVFTRLKDRGIAPNAGRARAAAMAFGLEMAQTLWPETDNDDLILLTTDADTVVSADWIEASVRSLADVDMIAGLITLDKVEPGSPRARMELYLDALHAVRRTVDPIDYDPAPSHPRLGGANLGFRAATYLHVGGFHHLAHNEDYDITDRVRLAGFKVRHDPRVKVVTSAREEGRAINGLATALRKMNANRAKPVLVEHPMDAVGQYLRHAAARCFFLGQANRRDAGERLADRLHINLATVLETLIAAPSADAFAMRVVPARETTRTVALCEAPGLLQEALHASRLAASA